MNEALLSFAYFSVGVLVGFLLVKSIRAVNKWLKEPVKQDPFDD